MRDYIARFFQYQHLPLHIQPVSRVFSELADFIIATLPPSTERSVALRKLLESKDAAVRGYIAGREDESV